MTIPNWSMFGPTVVSIELHRFEDEEDTTYNATITMFLDDTEDGKGISFITDEWDHCPSCLTHRMIESLYSMFPLSPLVLIFNEEGDVLHEIDMESEDPFKDVEIPPHAHDEEDKFDLENLPVNTPVLH